MEYPPLEVERWASEAPRLRESFQREMFGRLPEIETLETERVGELDERLSLRTLAARDGRRVDVLRATPTGPVRGTFVGVNFGGNRTVVDRAALPELRGWNYPDGVMRAFNPEVWSVEKVLKAGFGLATFCHSDVVPDEPALARPILERSGAEGAVAAWAWGLLSVAQTLPRPVVFVGHSRMGKAALLAGAFGGDGVACLQSGCGGAAPSRTEIGETVGQITTRFPHWFAPKFATYAGHEDRLPFDQHALIALCAPKPTLLLNADDDQWANPAGQEAMAELARPAFASLGAADSLGTFRRPGGHAVTQDDWAAILTFFERRLRPAAPR